MTIYDLILVFVLSLPALLIWQNAAFRDRVIPIAKRYCEQMDVQLLDDTVALTKLRLARDHRGNWGLKRDYQFEFSVSGEERYAGSLQLHGKHLQNAHLQPHRFH